MTPKHLYRFFDVTGALATLKTKKLRLTAPGYLNDPDDLFFEKTFPLSANEMRIHSAVMLTEALRKGFIPQAFRSHPGHSRIKFPVPDSILKAILEDLILNEEFAAQYEEHSKLISSNFNNFLNDEFSHHFLLCLTDKVSPQMWEVYGEKNRGVVFQFQCIPELDNIFLAASKVNYSDNKPTFGTREQWCRSFLFDEPIDHASYYLQCISWKHSKWSHENEWRIVIPEISAKGKQHIFLNFRPIELSAIILGSEINTLVEHEVMNLLREYPFTAVYKMNQI